MKKNIVKKLVGATFCIMATTTANAALIELATNGSFETGDLSGWTLTDSGSGTVEVTSNSAPSNATFETVGASDGSFYAVSYQGGPGTHAISQTFLVPISATEVILSFDMFVQTNANEVINTNGLDETVGPNQHARVDLMAFGSDAFDTGVGVLSNFYIGIDGAPTQPYTSYLFDITSLVTPGMSYDIRFAQSDNQGNFNLGVDNVSVQAMQSVPSPSTIALICLSIAAIGWSRRRKA